MTKIRLSGWGWIYLHVVLYWCSKEIIGYSLSATSKSSDWLDALNQAVNVFSLSFGLIFRGHYNSAAKADPDYRGFRRLAWAISLTIAST